MNHLIWVILALYLASELWESILTVINLRYSRHALDRNETLPAGLPVTAEELQDNYRYTSSKTKFSLISRSFGALITVLFFFTPVFKHSVRLAESLSLHPVLTGVVYFLVLLTIIKVINTPFDLYETFSLEKKHGFNNQTPTGFISDFIKGILLEAILTGLLMAGALWIIRVTPGLWWFWLWLFYFAFIVMVMIVTPYIIEPLYNRYSPVDNQELTDTLHSVLNKTGIRFERVLKMDASRRTKHSNAYFTGIGPVKRIVLFDTLLEILTPLEISAVLAHEAGHWKKKHVQKRFLASSLISLAAIFLIWNCISRGYPLAVFHVTELPVYAQLLFCGFAFSLFSTLTRPISSVLSRAAEYEADRFARSVLGSGKPLSDALVKLFRDNKSNLFAHPLYRFWNYSHPDLISRIKELEK